MKLLHISDIHLYAFEFSRAEFFTKSIFTNINHLFNRRFTHSHKPLMKLLADLKRFSVTHLLVSGDLTTTGSKKEFLLVKALFEAIEQQGVKIFALPGNHDINNKTLFNLLANLTNQSKENPFSRSKIMHCQLDAKYHMILLDSTIINHGLEAQGCFSDKMQQDLANTLSSIHKDEIILIANHFPILSYKKHKQLLGRDLLMKTLKKYDNVALYLHGHRHRHQIIKDTFTIVDAGCTSKKRNPTACLFDLTPDHIAIKPLTYNHNQWTVNEQQKNLISV